MLAPDERAFTQVTIPWDGEVPNSAGTATLAAADAIRHLSGSIVAAGDVIPTRAKTGDRSNLAGQLGRRSARFDLEVPLMGSGAAGTAPDVEAVWEAIFGKAGTVVASTSVTYDFADVVAGLAFWLFNSPTGASTVDRVVGGGIITEFEINPNPGDIATLRVSGPGVYVANKPNFASIDSGGKMGLTAFPSEPGSLSFAGFEIPGDEGSITINSVATFNLQSWTVRGTLAPVFRHAALQGRYPVVADRGRRTITLDVSLYLENTSDMAALRHLAYTKGTFDAVLVIGATAGSILTLNCRNMQISEEQVADAEVEQILNLTGLQMNASGSGQLNEFDAVWT
jgi:hypothetical protein